MTLRLILFKRCKDLIIFNQTFNWQHNAGKIIFERTIETDFWIKLKKSIIILGRHRNLKKLTIFVEKK